MEEIVKHYLDDNKVLIEKYRKAEQKYIKKLGSKYVTIQIDLDIEEEKNKKMFYALANSKICLDDYLISKLKIYIVEKEMEKLWESLQAYKEYGI